MIVTPGDSIVSVSGYVRGHGTYEENGELVSSVTGVVERVNKLIRVQPVQSRYSGEIGDVVIGRIKEVGSKRWKVDIRSRQDAILHLAMVNMPGGAQRRRTFEDQLNMRSLFQENDLISAEIHTVHTDGSVAVHARSLKYGKLENGQFVSVRPGLVQRLKQHFVTLPCGIDLILGLNGYIWVTESMNGSINTADNLSKISIGLDGNMLLDATEAEAAEEGLAEAIEKMKRIAAERIITSTNRLKISRITNSLLLLSQLSIPINPESIMKIYDQSITFDINPQDMLHPDNAKRLLQPSTPASNVVLSKSSSSSSNI